MRKNSLAFAIAALVGGLGMPAAAQERVPVPAQAFCSPDGRLVGIRFEAPFGGTFTLPIPPDICPKSDPGAKPKPSSKQPAPAPAPAAPPPPPPGQAV